tara:strand:+ start:493 stop:1365 length:873 start_codon:yes stop_codon:yes gene_type:complete
MIGILTSGGICPGINVVINEIVKNEINRNGNNVVGFLQGFEGLNKNKKIKIKDNKYKEHYNKGGSVLGTSRVKLEIGCVSQSMDDLDKLYCIGGDGTQTAAKILYEKFGNTTNIVGIGKTIDNDIKGIQSFGFYSAIEKTSECIVNAYNEAYSTKKIVIVETMGNKSGCLAYYSSIANNNIVDYCIKREDNINKEIYTAMIQDIYKHQGYGVIVMSENYNEKDKLLQKIKDKYIPYVMITPGSYVRSGEANVMDKIACVNMCKRVCNETEKGEKNVIYGVNTKIKYDNFN